MRYVILCGFLAGCAVLPEGLKPKGKPVGAVVEDAVITAEAPSQRPVARPAAGEVAQTPEAAATTPEPSSTASGALGTTVASLGSPAEPGLWIKTPLVSAAQSGKVSYGGKTIEVKLIPIEGPETAGSRLSLQGFQALGAPLTDLIEVSVSA